MHNPAWFDTYPLFISESSPEEYDSGSERVEWTDEEIAAIRAVLQKLTAIRVPNPTDAEDLVQDTLVTMLTKYQRCELQKGLLVWGMGILRKKVGNYYRKTQRLIATFSDQEPDTVQSVHECTGPDSPEAKLFQQELQQIVRETLEQFPFSQRQAIELLMTGLDSGEIVKQLHPERYQNVINRIHRGRKKLAKELAKYGYGPVASTGMRKMKRCDSRRRH